MRICAISDQHGFLPDIPSCDLLLVGGDNAPDYPPGARDRVGTGPQTARQWTWMKTMWRGWREAQPAAVCLATHGNHDYYGEVLHKNHGTHYGIRHPEKRTTFVVDGLVEVGGLKIWLTPWSSQFRDWAFMGTEEELAAYYAQIPKGIDILVSHTPPYGACDSFYDLGTGKSEHLGSKALVDALSRIKPRVLICGHIHGGYGQAELSVDYVAEKHACTHELMVYNVALVDEAYRLVHVPTVFDLEPVE